MQEQCITLPEPRPYSLCFMSPSCCTQQCLRSSTPIRSMKIPCLPVFHIFDPAFPPFLPPPEGRKRGAPAPIADYTILFANYLVFVIILHSTCQACSRLYDSSFIDREDFYNTIAGRGAGTSLRAVSVSS